MGRNTNAMRAVALPNQGGIALYNGDEQDHAIRSQIYTSGTGWGSLVKHDAAGTTPNIESGSLAAASDGGGNAFFVWSARDAQNVQRLWYTRYTNSAFAAAAMVVPVDVANPMASAGSVPKLIVDGMGRALLAFSNPSGAVWSEFVNGSWSAPHPEGAPALPLVNARGTGGLLGQNGLRLYSISGGVVTGQVFVGYGSPDSAVFGVDDAGNILVVWTAAGGTELSYRRFDAATQTLSPTAKAPASAATSLSGLQLKVAANGNALAVWSDTSASKLWGQRYVAGVGFQAPVEFQANNGSAPGTPQIAIDRVGDAVVVWQQGPSQQVNLWSSTLE
jgi:hypothetical protein